MNMNERANAEGEWLAGCCLVFRVRRSAADGVACLVATAAISH